MTYALGLIPIVFVLLATLADRRFHRYMTHPLTPLVDARAMQLLAASAGMYGAAIGALAAITAAAVCG